ncbi:MAG: HNH endonuclease [Myxococcales bacterium]
MSRQIGDQGLGAGIATRVARALCQVPGCSRGADHAHHIVFLSAGGSDDPSNLVSLCAPHHLHCVHMGWLRVTGTAPDGVRWELGLGACA